MKTVFLFVSLLNGVGVLSANASAERYFDHLKRRYHANTQPASVDDLDLYGPTTEKTNQRCLAVSEANPDRSSRVWIKRLRDKIIVLHRFDEILRENFVNSFYPYIGIGKTADDLEVRIHTPAGSSVVYGDTFPTRIFLRGDRERLMFRILSSGPDAYGGCWRIRQHWYDADDQSP